MAETPFPAAIDLLAADGPAPPLAEGLALFGRLVGSWDVESVVYEADGSERRERCEWHFAWVLGGRAVQDVLQRWRFSDISPDAFGWRGECSLDGGRSWRLQQLMQVRRRRG